MINEPGPLEMSMMFQEIDDIEALPEPQRGIARDLIDSGAVRHVGYRRWQIAEDGRERLTKYLEER